MPAHSTRGGKFSSIDAFYAFTESINTALTSENRKYRSQAVELIKRSADRTDIHFAAIMEADVLTYMASSLRGVDWYPQTHHYWSYGSAAQFFLRATQHRHFAKIAIVLGVTTGDELRKRFAEQKEKNIQKGWGSQQSFENLANLPNLDTIA